MFRVHLNRWTHRLRYWGTMFAGSSYYHQPQTVGRAFFPGTLKGYFNDLTSKTNWDGPCDSRGLPVSRLSSGASIHFPILVCQKGLGHWDRWLLQGDLTDREEFLKIAEWLRESQDSFGGWDTWAALGQPRPYCYSAMTQGEAVSVMVRAHVLTNDPTFAEACRHAVRLMQRPIAEGGVCACEQGEVFLEEYPGPRRDTVLNGWVFALFGLHDYLLRFPEAEVNSFYGQTCASLVRSLPEFDAGFWSFYSSGTKRLASPFYHQLHLSQLEALRQILDEPFLARTQAAWTRYDGNQFYKGWAVLRKGWQKLREPDEITILG